jgi:lysophospholipase L1-like esterase
MKSIMTKFGCAIAIALCLYNTSFSQNDSLPRKQYDFIRYDLNRFTGCDSSSNYNYFLQLFDSLMHHKNFQLNIVQFGGSHIQADVSSHFVREKMQTLDTALNGARGMLFPFKMVGTNNPSNYKVEYSGNWKGYRNAVSSHDAAWGVTGITGVTSDSIASIGITFKQITPANSFIRVRIFHNASNVSYKIMLHDTSLLLNKNVSIEDDYTLFTFKKPLDTLAFTIKKNNAADTSSFELYGILFENDNPGIVYHSIGVNGASFKSYLRCDKLEPQMKYMHPDLVIISIGTNDTFDPDFDSLKYETRYDSMISKISRVNPNVAFLLTVPNDSYMKKKYHNKNTAVAEKVIYKLADRHGLKVWNFYKVMGGKYSAPIWQNEDLMKSDRIHFTHKGYLVQGQLMFDAFMAEYWHWIEMKKPKMQEE